MAQKAAAQKIGTNANAVLQVIAHKKVQVKIKEILEDYQLNMTQWIIISRLSEKRSGLRTTDLARFMHVEVPLITMMSRSLRRRGLITSAVHTPDKRVKLLKLTSQAKEMVDVVETRLQKQLATMVKDVSVQDLQAYFKVLHTMMRSPA